jgi:hypothetical protein
LQYRNGKDGILTLTAQQLNLFLALCWEAKALPEKWTKPLNDRIKTSLGGFDNARFTDLARRTLLVAQGTAADTSAVQAQRSDDF